MIKYINKGLSSIELLLVLAILVALISLISFNIQPEDVFEQSDTVKIESDKSDIQTAYTKFKIDNARSNPIGQLDSSTEYRICRKEITDCKISNGEISLNLLIQSRLLKNIPIHPSSTNPRFTGYKLIDSGTSIEIKEEVF